MGRVKVVDNTIHSVKVVLYKYVEEIRVYLLLKEPEGLYSFVGGAQDEDDTSITESAKREIQEEIGLSNSYTLLPTKVTHEFVHTDPKSERFGKKGILHMFLARYTEGEKIILNDELQEATWNTQEEVESKLANAYEYLLNAYRKSLEYIPKN